MKFYSVVYFNDRMKINAGWSHVTNKSIYEVSKPTKEQCGKWEFYVQANEEIVFD